MYSTCVFSKLCEFIILLPNVEFMWDIVFIMLKYPTFWLGFENNKSIKKYKSVKYDTDITPYC